jgi:RHS repeat-associated protein
VFGRPQDIAAGNVLLTAWQGVTKGYTNHEHLNEQQLIHMNGRIYDFNVGRFLSVDPFLQFPENSQSANPYSYILNNPMSGTDPTGYLSETDQEETDVINGGKAEEQKQEQEAKVKNGQKNETRRAVRDNRSANKVGTFAGSSSSSFGGYGNNGAFISGYSSIKGDASLIVGLIPAVQVAEAVKDGIESAENIIDAYQENGVSVATGTVVAKEVGELVVKTIAKKIRLPGAVGDAAKEVNPKNVQQFESKRAALRAAKRDAGIPTSQTHTTHTKNLQADGLDTRRTATEYDFGGGRKIQDHPAGHKFPDGGAYNKSHFNNHGTGGTKGHYEY